MPVHPDGPASFPNVAAPAGATVVNNYFVDARFSTGAQLHQGAAPKATPGDPAAEPPKKKAAVPAKVRPAPARPPKPEVPKPRGPPEVVVVSDDEGNPPQ